MAVARERFEGAILADIDTVARMERAEVVRGLRRGAAGEETGELSLRDGDPLQETAALINRTPAAARAAAAERTEPGERAAA